MLYETEVIPRLSIVTAPDGEPVSLADAKLHLRLVSNDENSRVNHCIATAREQVEQDTGRALATQTWDLKLDRWPCYDGWNQINVPKPNLQSVTSISYVDTAGATQTLATNQYQVVSYSGPTGAAGRIVPAYGVSWPSLRCQPDAVTVRFVAGYGAEPEDVPESLRAAMLLVVGSLFEHREQVMVSQFAGQFLELPYDYFQLIGPYRQWQF